MKNKTQTITRNIIFGWTGFCAIGLLIGLISFSQMETSDNEFAQAGSAIGLAAGCAVWAFVWSAVSLPCGLIWLISGKKDAPKE